MKYLIFVLTVLVSVSTFAQNGLHVKTDGTKYYLQVYDGVTNKKVLFNNSAHASWQTKIQLADYFDGSGPQLWSFQATAMFPGYFSVINHDETLPETAFLMSWSWNAYMGSNRDPAISPEMQYRFVEVIDGWYKLETIEKEDGLNNQPYTPGADALNIHPDGFAQFRDVKSADITPNNMVNKVFKFVEFNPIKLFEESVARGQELYDNNPNAPEKVRYELFYLLEKAREVRVFGTEAEILAFQPAVDMAISNFSEVVQLNNIINDARVYINESEADQDVKNSFIAILDEAEAYSNSEDLDYTQISEVVAKIEGAKELIEAIIAAQAFNVTILNQDERLSAGLLLSIDAAKAVLAEITNDVTVYSNSISHLTVTQSIIIETIKAIEIIAATADYPDEKAVLNLAIEQAIGHINTVGASVAVLDQALIDIQDAIEVFKNSLSTPVILKNADFELDLADWNVESLTPAAAYAQSRGIDGSRSITFWRGSDYDMMVYQSISDIPNGVYKISCYFRTSHEGSIGLFAESGTNIVDLPLAVNTDAAFIKSEIDISVTDGTLRFGIRGQGVDNVIPAGNWIIFDNFDVKWTSKYVIPNGDFEQNLTDWNVEGVTAAAYPDSKGIAGSTNITCWRGSDYDISVSQTHTPIANGTYEISVMAQTKTDATFVVFGESDGIVNSEPITGNVYSKFTTTSTITNGTLKFGVRGAGANNFVAAGEWVRFDDFQLAVKSIVPQYVLPAAGTVVAEVVKQQQEAFRPESKIVYYPIGQQLDVQSSSAIVEYAVYNLTGVMIIHQKVNANTISISMNKGIYIVKVVCEDGYVDTEKISIR